MLHRTASTLVLLALACAARAQEEPFATIDDVRPQDLYAGELPAADAEIHFIAYLAEKAKLTITAQGEDEIRFTAAAGLRLALFGPDGAEIVVSGTKNDVSKPAENIVKWKNVKAAQTGFHTFVLTAGSAGGFSFRLDGNAKDAITTAESAADLDLGEETFIDFAGLARGRVKGAIKAPGKGNELLGQFTRVQQPSGDVLGAEDFDEKGRLFLREDGTHRAFFRNVGTTPGAWKVEIKSRAPTHKRRKGLITASGVIWQPKVTDVTPRRAFHRLDEVRLTITGRELQPNPDVRLLRKGRDDILCTDIERISDTEVRCSVDLDTRESEYGKSVGTWKVGVWNAPEYAVPGDRTTLIKDSPTRDEKQKFKSLANGDIALPQGTEDRTEMFVLEFSGGFAADIARMGFSSTDPVVADRARRRLEDYVVLYLRHLFLVNETKGRAGENAVRVCFVRTRPPGVAGAAGAAYNVLQVGGEQEPGDPRDPDEILDWGFVPFDAGNMARDVFQQKDEDGDRSGRGVRLRFLDPDLPQADDTWVEAMDPLREDPLGHDDRRYFQHGYFPYTVEEAERMKDITLQTERAAREIAAVIAHHVAKALGVDSGGGGPTVNPSLAGAMWTTRLNLEFTLSDLDTLRALAVPHDMPGKSERFIIPWFTLASTVAFRLPDALTGEFFAVELDLFGGRPNTRNSDYRAGYASGSGKPLGMTLKVSGLSGRPPLYRAGGQPYCALENMRINFTDTKHDVRQTIRWQMRVFSDVGKLRPQDQQEAQNCNRELEKL